VNLPAFFTSALVAEDGLPVMIVNWAKSELERRTAVAHMLGHVLLVMNGDEAYPRRDPDHRDADSVARELVLPTAMVVDQARLWFNDYRYLARLFGVAEPVMLERMKDMGIIKGPDGLIWDY
jgi:Zn-dependent peptidase ImmA (M78 family)